MKKKCGLVEDEQRRRRDADHDTQLQRYQNVRKELENTHNLERVKLEKAFGKQLLAQKTMLAN